MANYQKIDNSFTSYYGESNPNNVSLMEQDRLMQQNITEIPNGNAHEEKENLNRKSSSQEEIAQTVFSPEKKSSSSSEEKQEREREEGIIVKDEGKVLEELRGKIASKNKKRVSESSNSEEEKEEQADNFDDNKIKNFPIPREKSQIVEEGVRKENSSPNTRSPNRMMSSLLKIGKGGLSGLSKGLSGLTSGLKVFGNVTSAIGGITRGLGLNVENLNLLNIFKKKPGDKLTKREQEILAIKGHMKRCDTVAAAIAFLNSVLSYWENEDFYSLKSLQTGDPKKRNESTLWGNLIRCLVILLTGALLVCIYLHYYFKLKILKKKRLRLPEDSIRSAGLLWKLSLEVFFCSICTPPYFDYTFEGTILGKKYVYSCNAIINVITLFKGYLILRLYGHYSPWTNEKAVRICKKNRCQAGVTFAIKAELKRRPYIMLGILMLITIVYLGLAMRTFEISYEPNFDGTLPFDFEFLANSMWLIIITMTTVGFGEGFPSTHLGRFIGVMACIIGMLLVSLMVVSLTMASEFTPEESKAFFILKKIYANDTAKEKAANVIKDLFRLRQHLKYKDASSFTHRFIWLTKLKKNVGHFKNDYRIANSHNLPIDEMLKNLQDKLESDINDIKKEVESIPQLEEKFKEMSDNQSKISEKLDEIVKVQGLIGEYMIKLNTLSKNNFRDI